MERILSVQQMRLADKYTIETLGIASDILVERAGAAVAGEIKKRFKGGRVLVCVGKGNNGKDGEVIAALLSREHGFTVNSLNVSNGIFKMLDMKFDIIVDCIFGTGLDRPVEGKFRTAIEKINASGAYVVSCDVPSGLNGDTGMPMGIAVKADLTVAVQEYKLGHFLNDGPDLCGEVVAKDIGISIWGSDFYYRLTDSDVKTFFGPRKRNVHKGMFGKAAVVGGSKYLCGSALLSFNALNVLKAGAGYSCLAVPESLYNVYAAKVPECLMHTIPDENGQMIFDENALKKLLSYDSIAVGMGMGRGESIYKIICFLLKNYSGNLIIDADGINALADFGTEILKEKKCKVALLPHIGEFARIIKVNRDDIMPDIISYSKEFASEFDVVLAVKSAVSVITDGDIVILNTTGSGCMAKAGSGDVLSGFVAGLCASNELSAECVASACYVFGKAGEICAKEQNDITVVASDLISRLPDAVNGL